MAYLGGVTKLGKARNRRRYLQTCLIPSRKQYHTCWFSHHSIKVVSGVHEPFAALILSSELGLCTVGPVPVAVLLQWLLSNKKPLV